MNKSNNDNIKEGKTQLTNNASRLAEQDLEHISELSEQDWEGVSGGVWPLLALAAGRIIVPAVGGFIAKEVLKNEGSEFVENIEVDSLQGFGGGGDILL
ncbi:MAG: hypothetical protein RLZZ74_415 [Cyanobacteriota bacterium]|jgi:lactobin A/cerein 7B family class IIb bacteriocin